MDKKYSIFGIGFDDLISWEDKFEVEYDDAEDSVLVSKETFHHDEDDLVFDYKYVIERTLVEDETFYALYMVVCNNSINEELMSEIMGFCGLEQKEDVEMRDIISYASAEVMFGNVSEKTDEENTEIYDKIASVFETMDRLRGFYIDKPWNMIGTTGWDTLRHAVLGEALFKHF